MWQGSISAQLGLPASCLDGSFHFLGAMVCLVPSTENEQPRITIQNEMKLTARDGGAHMKF